MAIKINMPALSPTMTEGSIVKWLVKVGDTVKAGDILAEIETDKATMEVEAVDEGTITTILFDAGSNNIPVNSTIAIINGDNDFKTFENKSNKEIKNKTYEDNNKDYIDTNELNNLKKEHDPLIKNNKILASPLVKNLAKVKDIDLESITGSGPEGRIIKRDLKDFTTINFSKNTKEDNSVKPSSIRKIIADRTTLTKQTVPHYYLTIESNVDKLIKMRKKINESSKNKISINDILVKALATAQFQNPITNASWINNRIVNYSSVDVSIAVALEDGLITPIIKNADKKGIIEISIEINNLMDKSKKGKLLPQDYEGGTISISNLGMFGITEFAAIINPPQSCILAVGAITKKPTVIDNEILPVNILKSTLSADHRILDGAVAGKLLKDFNNIIEDPFQLWLKSNDMEII